MTRAQLILSVLLKMLKIKLQAEFERLKVTEYDIFYPASIYINKKLQKKINYSVSVLKCKNIQGSFLLYYSRKIDLSTIRTDDATVNTVGGTLSNSLNVQVDDDDTALQYVIFKKRLLLYADEDDSSSYLNDRLFALPAFLLHKIDDIQNSVQFWLEYESDSSLATTHGEDITIYLKLKIEDE